MSATKAIIGVGTIFAISAVGANTYVAVAEVVDSPPPTEKVNKSEATNYDSPAGSNGVVRDEFIIGVITPGESKMKLNYHKSQVGVLQSILGLRRDFKVTFPDTTAIKWTGWISENGFPSVPVKERIVQEFSVQSTGEVVIIAAS